jgi:hypothetical protein
MTRRRVISSNGEIARRLALLGLTAQAPLTWGVGMGSDGRWSVARGVGGRRGGDRRIAGPRAARGLECWWVSGWGSARDGAADGRGSVRIGAADGCESTVGVGSLGCESARIGAARSGGFRGVCGRAGRHRHRRLRERDSIGGDSGRPLPRYEPSGDAGVPSRRGVAIRGATKAGSGIRGAIKARSGDAGCQQGSYRGRGCPESPHRAW